LFTVVREASLPPLAWIATWLGDGPSLVLTAGDGVEVGEDAWVEGAWAGRFEEFRFEDAWLAGTGGRCARDELVLVPPFHSCDAVWLTVSTAGLIASNSLALLLARSGLRLDGADATTTARLANIVNGVDHHHVTIAARGRESIHACFVRPVHVSRQGELSFGDVTPVGGFEGFHDYRRRLAEVTAAIVENASSPHRRRTYRPVATVSTGYDSPAAAVLASEAGATEALTIVAAKGADGRSTDDDSGHLVAEALGMSTVRVTRDTRLSRSGVPVVKEFWSGGMSGGDLPFLEFEPYLGNTVLFTGFHGGKVWTRSLRASRTLMRGDLSGASMTDFRLRVGFIHLPVPFIFATNHDAIFEVTHAEEMKAWSVGGEYDRPIPRRIAEEAGVPRASFGHEKRAVYAVGDRRYVRDTLVRRQILAHFWENASGVGDAVPHLQAGLHGLSHLIVRKSRLEIGRLIRALPGHRGPDRPAPVQVVPPKTLQEVRFLTLGGWMGAMAFTWAAESLAAERYAPHPSDAGRTDLVAPAQQADPGSALARA
jgi:hypothetical protein